MALRCIHLDDSGVCVYHSRGRVQSNFAGWTPQKAKFLPRTHSYLTFRLLIQRTGIAMVHDAGWAK
jgi:hypothetical protein